MNIGFIPLSLPTYPPAGCLLRKSLLWVMLLTGLVLAGPRPLYAQTATVSIAPADCEPINISQGATADRNATTTNPDFVQEIVQIDMRNARVNRQVTFSYAIYLVGSGAKGEVCQGALLCTPTLQNNQSMVLEMGKTYTFTLMADARSVDPAEQSTARAAVDMRMYGSAPQVVTPSVFQVTGGGNYTTAQEGVEILLSDSEVGVVYQLQRGGVNVGAARSGTGGPIGFGYQTAGTYSVVATSLCGSGGTAVTMQGTPTVTLVPSGATGTSYSGCDLILATFAATASRNTSDGNAASVDKVFYFSLTEDRAAEAKASILLDNNETGSAMLYKFSNAGTWLHQKTWSASTDYEPLPLTAGYYRVNVSAAVASQDPNLPPQPQRASADVTIYSASPYEIDFPNPPAGNLVRCQGSGTDVFTTPNAQNAGTYTWSVFPANAAVSVTGSGNTATVTWNENFFGGAEITVVGTNSCGKSARSSSIVTVNAAPATPAVSANSPVAEGGTLQLSTPFISGASYAWTGPNGFTSTSQNPSIANVTPNAAGTYSLRVTINGCQSLAGQVTVQVNARPCTVVSNLNDSGPGSLRAAFICANENPDYSTITFELAPGTPQPYAITLLSALPDLIHPVNLNGGGQGITVRGNGNKGVFLTNTADNSIIQGLTFEGFAQPANTEYGAINVTGADNCSILNNVVVNNVNGIVANGGSNLLIAGNFVGIRPDNTAGGNGAHGILTIGVTTLNLGKVNASTTGNIVSHQLTTEVDIRGCTAVVMRGNFLGTNVTGQAYVGRVVTTLYIRGGSSNLEIGGAGAGEGNVLTACPTNRNSFRAAAAIEMTGATDVRFYGNKIGTDVTGSYSIMTEAAASWYTWGISVNGGSSNVKVGGPAAGQGNQFVGHQYGIEIIDNSSNVIIQGNKFGTNAAGTLPLGQSYAGVGIIQGGGHHITVGGTQPGEGNIFASAAVAGLWIQNGNNVTVLGNFIGVNPAGTRLGNSGFGILAEASGTNTIGNTGAGRNLIAHNDKGGIGVRSSTANRISGNLIYGNGEAVKAIDLHLGAANAGNASKAAPQLTVTALTDGTHQVTATAAAGDVLEFFAGDGPQNARRFLVSATASSSGTHTFTVSLTAGETYVLATATNAGNNTSQLSSIVKPVYVPPVCAPLYTGTGPGGVGSSANNKFWFDASKLTSYADGAKVNQWTDVSGNGWNAVQGVSVSNQPTYRANQISGMAAINFNRTPATQYLEINRVGVGEMGSNSNSVFAVARQATLGVDEYSVVSAFVGFHTALALSNGSILAEQYVGGVISNVGTGYSNEFLPLSGAVTPTNAPPASNWTLASRVSSETSLGTNFSLYGNGALIGTQSSPKQMSVFTHNMYRIGTGAVAGKWFGGLNGDVAEVIGFNEALNGARRTIVENYLAAKYGLPIANDYYSSHDPSYTRDVQGIGSAGGTNKHSQAAASKGLILMEWSSSLDVAGEFVFAGHNTVTNGLPTTLLPPGIDQRWQRDWYVQKSVPAGGNGIRAKLIFDFQQAGLSLTEDLASNLGKYRLLRRGTSTGAFQVVNALPILESTGAIGFLLDDAALVNGYYTLGIANAGLLVEFCPGNGFNLPFNSCPTTAQTFTAQLSNRDATTFPANPVVIGSGGPAGFPVTLPAVLAAGRYLVRVVAPDGTAFVITAIRVNSCEPSIITLGTVTGNPFCTNGPVSASVPFTTSGPFAPGQVYTAQTVNTDNTFTNIGQSTTSPVPVTLPAGTSTYQVRIVAGEVVSANIITLNVTPQVTVSLQSSATGPVCQGTEVTFTATSNSPDATYTFKVGATVLPASRLNTYTTKTLANGQQVTVEVSAPNGCKAVSTPVTITVNPVPTATLSRVRNTTCSTVSNGALSVAVAGAAPGDTYTLLKFGVPVGNYTNRPVTVTSLTGLDAGRYQVRVQTGAGCTALSNEIEIQAGTLEVDLCEEALSCTPGAQNANLAFRVKYRGTPPANFRNGFLYQVRRGTDDIIVPPSALLTATQQGDDLYGTDNGTGWSAQVTIPNVTTATAAGYVLDVWLATSEDPACQVCREEGCIRSFDIVFPTPAITLAASQSQYFVCSATDQAEVPVNLLATIDPCNTRQLGGYELSVTSVAGGAVMTPTSNTVVSNAGARIEVNQVYQLSPGRYRIATRIGPGTFNCEEESFIEVTPLGLQVAVTTTRQNCNSVVATASVSGNVNGAITYRWLRRNEATNAFELYPSAAAPFIGPQVTLDQAGDYRLQIGQERATCQANATFTVADGPKITGITLSEVTNCTIAAGATVPEAGRYRVEWYAKAPNDPANDLHALVYTQYVDVPAGQPLASVLPEAYVLPAGNYYVRIYDRWDCSSQSDPVERIRTLPNRVYDLCVQWEKVPILQEPPPVVEVQTMPALMASDTRRVISDAIGQCVENQVKIVKALANPEKCLEAVNDALVLTYDQRYYHYTLYYYDRAGNLTKTVPPSGVRPLPGTNLSPTEGVRPAHELVTTYDYNSLGQLMRQQTPDGGTTHFVYNAHGQLRLSQNDKQKQEETNAYSYTKYDALGRVVEVGQAQPGGSVPVFNGTIASANEILLVGDRTQGLAPVSRFPAASQATLSQQTVTVYSEPSPDGIAYPNRANGAQRYLRNRVSYSYATNRADNSRITTYYSYDPHGNVEWLTQDLPGAGRNFIGYEYDLISGKVLRVRFNEHRPDRFFHRYAYDEDNRLTNVETSRDGFLWDRDASYQYYRHGPLRRLALGHDNVQGLDYTYTIHGWLKGINAPTASLADDPGGDEATAGNPFVRDEFAMALGYYRGDFRYNGSVFDANTTTGIYNNGFTQTDLFNGNISSWIWRSNRPLPAAAENFVTEGHTFRYDLLNRLRSSNRSVLAAGTWTAGNALRTSYTYDGNGNLITLTRNDQAGQLMDNFTYTYATINNKPSNRLASVADAVGTTAATEDLEGTASYQYDRIGNLIKDENTTAGTNNTIHWNVYGKVSEVVPADNTRPRTRFRYDAAGNRVAKIQLSAQGVETDATYYVRDASGNILATYGKRGENTGDPLQLLEQPIYGSDRVGQRQQPVYIQSTLGNLTRDGYVYQWTRQSGPAAVVLETPNEPDLRLSSLRPGTYVFRLSVTDPQGSVSSDDVTLVVPAPVYPLPGVLSYERWDNIPGATVVQVPTNTAPSFTRNYALSEVPADAGDNFAARLRGYVHPPTTGYYRFQIAADEQAQLFLSTDEDPSLKRKIAEVLTPTTPRDWNAAPSQESGQYYLEAGRRYYIEALHKEATGGDNVAIGWRMPGGVLEQPIQGTVNNGTVVRLSGYIAPAPSAVSSYPTVALAVSPAASVPTGTLLTLQARAADTDGVVTKVEYFVDNAKVGEDTEAPFAFAWTPLQAGYYTLSAKVTDNAGAGGYAEPVRLSVQDGPAGATFHRAINLNGDGGLRIDGNVWEGKTALYQSITSQGTYSIPSLKLDPLTDDTRSQMLRTGIWQGTSTGVQYSLGAPTGSAGAMPSGTYLVYLYAVENDFASQPYSITLEGQTVLSNYSSGAGGWWRKLGPYQVPVSDGVLNLTSTGGHFMLSGIEVWRVAAGQRQSDLASAFGGGGLRRESWYNIGTGGAVNQIPLNTVPHEVSTVSDFKAPSNLGDNMGSRLRGYVCPPVSGYYTFWIASDDQSQLLLSSDEQPGGKREIAYNVASTLPEEWGKNAYQRSEPQWLEAGKKYYVEALHKESITTDHLAVGWQLPDGSLERPIPSKRLSPFVEALGRSVLVRAIELNGPSATIEGNSWEGTATPGQTLTHFSLDGWTQSRATATLSPAVTDAAKALMLRNTVAKHSSKDRLKLEVGNLEQGVYQVYLYVYEPSVTPKEYSLLLEGLGPGGKPLGQEAKYRTGTQYAWAKIGPLRAEVNDKAATVEVVSTDYVYVGGLEVYRELQAAPQPTVVRAGADFTLPEYLSSYTLRGGADRILTRSTGYKAYELQDHLGNVRVVVGDVRQARVGTDGLMQLNAEGNPFLRAAVRSFAHYYPFGMAEPGGTFQAQGAGSYRYGYNGKELDKEGLGGGGSTYDYGFRIYNPNIAKFLSVDPLAGDYPSWSPYPFAMNRPINGIDLDGLEWKSSNSWNDLMPNTKVTYADHWKVEAAVMLQQELANRSKDDCADIALKTLIQYSAKYSLPFHIEGRNTGEDRIYDNDLMQFSSWQELYKAVAKDYAASDLFNKAVFMTQKSFGNLQPGDLVLWNFYGDTPFEGYTSVFHTQTVTKVVGDRYVSIQGSTGDPVYAKGYSIEDTEKGRLGPVTGLLFPHRTKAKSWNFAYMDKFKNFDSMIDMDARFDQILNRITEEYTHSIGVTGTTFKQLPNNDRIWIHHAAREELKTGKPALGKYNRNSYTWQKE